MAQIVITADSERDLELTLQRLGYAKVEERSPRIESQFGDLIHALALKKLDGWQILREYRDKEMELQGEWARERFREWMATQPSDGVDP